MPKAKLFTSIEALLNYFDSVPRKLRNATYQNARTLALQEFGKHGQVKFGWGRAVEGEDIIASLFAPEIQNGELIAWNGIPTYVPPKVIKLTKAEKEMAAIIGYVQKCADVMRAGVEILAAHEEDKINAKYHGTPTTGARNVRVGWEAVLGMKLPTIQELRAEFKQFSRNRVKVN